ncbi:amino acid permease [Clostridium autoethanogenum]|uniref:Amino acid permease n=1 Tax=Clostridium autoethanogenum TaxID=84023 RepID=A0A3M0T2D9_9CLOT|nr:amino acid permease [Clostridium autoethanogenum]RMD04790.1 amino acid permease [Clostridium autoethanogenum]
MKSDHKGLSAVQLTMMALGTVIGGSFFLGSAVAIHASGPSIIIAYILGGILVYFILSALSEMTVSDPAPGSFATYAGKAFGRGTEFMVGWVYWTGMVLAMSSEAAAVSILIRRWFPKVSISLIGSIVIICITLLNLLGASKLSKLESALASFKIAAILCFVIIGILLVTGLIGGVSQVKLGRLGREPFFAGGIKSIAGSMLIIMFAYAGFEIIGLAASETKDPKKVIPKAIRYTVLSLVGLYIASAAVIIFLIPTAAISENVSPMVAALNNWGMGWAGNVMNIIMITAILSTMLAAMFGLGRMIRSLADRGHAPALLRDKKDVPYRGMMLSGFSMLLGLIIGLLFPKVYLFLVSSGGFALLFTYAIIVASHIRFRKKNLQELKKKGYPYGSLITLISLAVIIASMPFISGQTSGLIAGIIIIAVYLFIYLGVEVYKRTREAISVDNKLSVKKQIVDLLTEFSEEITDHKKDKKGK